MRFKIVVLRVLPLLFFLALSLPHHPFSRWLDAEFIIPYGFETMQFAANIGSWVLAVVGVLLAAILFRRMGSKAGYQVGFWILLLIAMYAVDRTLIVNNIERVHYPEYAFMSFLLSLTLQNQNLVFLSASFAGFADELLQFSMNPQKTNYLDFNDIVLNILGAGLGVALVLAFRRRSEEAPSKYEMRFRTVALAITSVFAVIVAVALAAGRIILVSDVVTDRSVVTEVGGKLSFVLGFERHDDFWIKSDFGKVFHILSPLEGVVLACALVALFIASFRWLKRRADLAYRLSSSTSRLAAD